MALDVCISTPAIIMPDSLLCRPRRLKISPCGLERCFALVLDMMLYLRDHIFNTRLNYILQ